MKKEVYTTLACNNCGHSWDITFKNTSHPLSEYAMAIEQKLSELCPDCGSKKMYLFDKTKLTTPKERTAKR